MSKEVIKKFRKDLKKGKALIGGWIQVSNSNIAEIMSSADYSWIAFNILANIRCYISFRYAR